MPLYNVLWAELVEDVLEVSLLARKKPKLQLSLVHIAGKVEPAVKDNALIFTGSLMQAAYGGRSSFLFLTVMGPFNTFLVDVKQRRSLRVLVNPRSGPVSIPSIKLFSSIHPS